MATDYTIPWRKTDEQILGFFDEFIAKNYPDFSFKYAWNAEYSRPLVYLEKLMLASYINSTDIRENLPKYIHDIEDYLATGLLTGIFNAENFDAVMDSLEDIHDGCRVINFLPPNMRHCYGRSIGNILEINPVMTRHPNSPNLTADETRKLYMFHELGHKILHIRDDYETIRNFMDTIASVLNRKGYGGSHSNQSPDLSNSNYIYDGFAMLEESMTQELAEYLTYASSRKTRPAQSLKLDMDVNVLTNHDYYGIFQKPAVQFGRTLRGCATVNSTDEEVELAMIRKALRGNFAKEVFAEYYQGDADLYYDLFKTLRCMGFLKNNKYATLGLADAIRTSTTSLLDAIEYLCNKNKDTRDYPMSGFIPVNFSDFSVPPGAGRR